MSNATDSQQRRVVLPQRGEFKRNFCVFEAAKLLFLNSFVLSTLNTLRHALVGSDVRLSCSFFSWRWTSEDVTFSWTYRPDGSRESISIFHYTGGMAYLDNKGPFRDRLEFVGNPGRRDGSIILKNVDFGDNGTFTCDAKNPPDIVGRPSTVRLLFFEMQNGYISTMIQSTQTFIWLVWCYK
uniref:Myelin protein zero n=1 Tax=Neogobius melanostomus TaxID=47308 RepID=A0A8C6UNV5_9GOBI